MIKGSIHQGDMTIVSIHAPNIRVHKYIKQTLTELKGEINTRVTIGDFNTSLSVLNKTSRQINKKTEEFNSTIDQMNLTIPAERSPQWQQTTRASQANRNPSLGEITGQVTKQALANLRRLKSRQVYFSDYRRMKTEKFTNTRKVNNTFWNNHWAEKEKKEIRKYLKTNNKNTIYQNLWDETKAAVRRKLITINADIKKEEKS